MVVIGASVVVAAVVATIIMPPNPYSKPGIGADGFQAFMEKDTDLGIGSVVSKDEVVAVLGKNAKSVENVSVSGVFNYNGDRGQTATYKFVRADGRQASLYVDVMVFKSSNSMDDANIYVGTGEAKVVNGHQAYYMHAQTLGITREYRVMVVNGLKAYKFVIDQPFDDITINEVSSVAALLKLAQNAKL